MAERVEMLLEPTGRSFASYFMRARDEETFPVTVYRHPEDE